MKNSIKRGLNKLVCYAEREIFRLKGKKIILLAALVCFAVLNVSAQTEEQETKGQKYFRLTKTADDNPTDWKAQLEAGRFLLDKENGIYNESQAEKYFDRLFHLATDNNKEIADSVIGEVGMALMTIASNKKDIDKAMFYIDEMRHAEKVGINVDKDKLFYVSSWGLWYSMIIQKDVAKSLSYILDMRDKLTKDSVPGIEYTDVFTAIVFEGVTAKYRNMFGDRVVELTFDGKKYYMISSGEWNIEQPLRGWMQTEEGKHPLLYGEDGKVYDDIHGHLEFNFLYDKGCVKQKEGANAQLVTITPEHRQQMVEAYHNYMKKAKKNNKQ